MKKNQRGFTLIELLVVIALMLSILGIAIVSFINISNNKKKEAWEDVKAQIETAATEYFTANEYLFEGLSDGGIGNISVGKLVSEDYLNKVTDPTTGKSVDECMEVKVEKSDGKYNATYTGNFIGRNADGTCINKYLVETSEPGAPSGEIIYRKSDNEEAKLEGDWFNITSLGERKPLKVCIVPNTNGNGAITTAKIGNFEVTNTGSEYCTTITNDGKYSDVIISLENTSGKKWQVYEDINKDTIRPEGVMDIYSSVGNKYNSNIVNTYTDVKDNIEVTKVNLKGTDHINDLSTNNVKEGYQKRLVVPDIRIANSLGGQLNLTISAIAYDAAGNSGDITSGPYSVYKDCQEANRIASGNWYNKAGATCSDKCGGTIAQERNTEDKNSGNSCTQKLSQNANCGGKTFSGVTYGSYGSCSKTCGGGTKTRPKYNNYVSTIDSSYSCGKVNAGTDSASCNTKSCTTKDVCSNLNDYVSITSSTHRTLNGAGYKTKADGDNYTYVDFNFNISNNKIDKVETHAAFCADKNTCLSVKTSNKGQDQVQCFSKWNCKTGWEYVGASIEVKCGSTTKTLYYSHEIGTTNTWTKWE